MNLRTENRMEWIPVFTGMTKRGTGMASPSVTPRSGSDEGSPSLLKKGKRRFSRLNTLPQNNSVDLSFPNVFSLSFPRKWESILSVIPECIYRESILSVIPECIYRESRMEAGIYKNKIYYGDI